MTPGPTELLRPGGTFGAYVVVKELGEGGMGSVYLVRDPRNEAELVVKLMHPVIGSRDFERRFIREAEIAMRIEHPNLVKVYEVGRDPETGLAFMVMDYESGGSLRDRIAEKLLAGEHFTVREALDVVRRIAGALEAVSATGAVHRDVKPDNILFDAEGEPVLADLGVAKVESDASTVLTMSNVIVGTPSYMAPEHLLDSHSADCRADIYSLGIVLWEMLAGERPNADATQAEIMARAVRGDRIPDIRTMRPKTPRYVVELLQRMCDPKPERRFSTPIEIVRFLDDWRTLQERRFRTFLAWTLSATAVVIAAVVALGVWWIREDRRRPAEPPPSAESEGSAESEFSIPKEVE